MCVDIVIIGITHFDPLGRAKIQKLLSTLSTSGFIPDCIAAEWDEAIAETVINQRDSFVKMAHNKCPVLTTETINALSESIAYEADSHYNIYPNLPIIWLDSRRENVCMDLIQNYASDRLSLYIDFLRELKQNQWNDLNAISLVAWNRTKSSSINDTSRDKSFFELIEEAIDNGRKRIFIIVGAAHANISHEGTLGNLLSKKPFTIQVFYANKVAL